MGVLAAAVLSMAGLLSACGGGTNVFSSGSCETKDGVFEHGETFPASDGCNTCSCDDGAVSCTEMACQDGCQVGDEQLAPGESYNDGCNECVCDEGGVLSCTDVYCGPFDCTYLGETRSPGSSFPARDGCNTCTCNDDGSVSCTELACACDADAEWWRDYVGDSPAACATIDFGCPDNTVGFENACGCGCEQDAMCAERYDCTRMTCNVPYLTEHCPYSEILE